MAFPSLGTNGRDRKVVTAATRRTYLASTEQAGTLYRPKIAVPERLRAHFEPLFVTDEAGELTDAVREDLGGTVAAAPAAVPLLERAPQ
jgi:hypothetical protein